MIKKIFLIGGSFLVGASLIAGVSLAYNKVEDKPTATPVVTESTITPIQSTPAPVITQPTPTPTPQPKTSTKSVTPQPAQSTVPTEHICDSFKKEYYLDEAKEDYDSYIAKENASYSHWYGVYFKEKSTCGGGGTQGVDCNAVAKQLDDEIARHEQSVVTYTNLYNQKVSIINGTCY